MYLKVSGCALRSVVVPLDYGTFLRVGHRISVHVLMCGNTWRNFRVMGFSTK